jgi:hypothetical protein
MGNKLSLVSVADLYCALSCAVVVRAVYCDTGGDDAAAGGITDGGAATGGPTKAYHMWKDILARYE